MKTYNSGKAMWLYEIKIREFHKWGEDAQHLNKIGTVLVSKAKLPLKSNPKPLL